MKTYLPTDDEIAERAYQIWQDQGQPIGHDLENWLEAQRELINEACLSAEESGKAQARRTTTESKAEFNDRAKVETAAESVVEYYISPAVSDEEAVRAAFQKKEARAPQLPTHQGPKSKPAESGKPLWNQPHSV